ncbi:flagellar motor switch protein FliN [Reinekea marinisedimentorum]|uniref:Flagellar motor switch protein FliN n=1 Tax=Reinekea marinisedimentorum TaxID=230495 RepID=A0A4R3I8H9_9GAMM|nr:flagellar motor switch protein FliN [Reinekea marinisedimentorum]TCS42424.1 flagellar motor switch protein FliN/FliY [Reinekea marinisedimentorum]
MGDDEVTNGNKKNGSDSLDIDANALADEVAASADDQALADEWAAAMEESGDAESSEPEVAPLEQFASTSGQEFDEDNPNLDVILDIPVTISMEVGSTEIPIRNLLQLNQGSVIELDRLAGEPLDVLVNGRLIAHGEVVMVNEKFGIRLTDVVSQQERVKRLR